MGRRVSSKVSCTVLSGGKSGDNFKGLPIAIAAENTIGRAYVFSRAFKKNKYSSDYTILCTA